jgi:prepilin-type N-terminal cleavage/methylation domain-containing protein
MKRAAATDGFTLFEVLAALAISGVAVFILLDAHHSALNLHRTVDEEITFRQLIETVIGRADLEIRAGHLQDSGDFGSRFPGYAWSYEAAPRGSDELILLYEVTATVTAPEEQRQLKFFVYDTGMGSLLDSGSTTSRESVFR